jgi:hypothetical protein
MPSIVREVHASRGTSQTNGARTATHTTRACPRFGAAAAATAFWATRRVSHVKAAPLR